MSNLEIKCLTAEQLSAAVELDRLCFGGLWTFSGYERELASPNSQLLVLEACQDNFFSDSPHRPLEKKDQNREEQGNTRARQSQKQADEQSLSNPVSSQATENYLSNSASEYLDNLAAQCQELTSPSTSLLGLGCYWSILQEAHITIIAVHPDYRRQGLGQFLLHSLLKDSIKRNLEMATLEVKPSNQAAISLYQKFGFKIAGRRRHYYQDTGEDALILWRGGLQSEEFEEIIAKHHRLLLSRLSFGGWQLTSKVRS